MSLEQTLTVLRKLNPFLKERFGIESLGVFGSVARNEAGKNSDVDIVVEMPPDLYAMVHIKEYLEEALNAPVDLVRYRTSMNALLKKRIEREVVYV
ncbi:MAG: nucleotidyltransferase family protein [Candidatus Aegiribacteria sp.]|nr:nucleotidyltransferase family protein [Candidatus Aegiribacteria sp.]